MRNRRGRGLTLVPVLRLDLGPRGALLADALVGSFPAGAQHMRDSAGAKKKAGNSWVVVRGEGPVMATIGRLLMSGWPGVLPDVSSQGDGVGRKQGSSWWGLEESRDISRE